MAPAVITSEERELLEAAARLLEESGYAGFTMDRLAEATGFSRATLYRRLGGRETVLQRLGEAGLIEARQSEPPDVRTRILQAVRTVFGRVGVAEASIEEIAREAGVGPATIYRHFKDREGLMLAFAEHMRPTSWARELWLEPSDDVEADLFALVVQLVSGFHAARDMILLVIAESRRLPELVAGMTGVQERTQQRVAAWLEARIRTGQLEPGDPFEMAGVLVGMVLSLSVLVPTLYGRPMEDPEKVARFIVHTFLDGLRAGSRRQV